jgi:hypothetical protein
VKEALVQKLEADFPTLYKEYNSVFDIGDGWFDLIYELSSKLEPLSKSINGVIVPVQIKEKFGGLRYYLGYHNAISFKELDSEPVAGIYKQMLEFESDYEAKSFHICEACGKPGETSNKKKQSWLKTYCEEHNK